VLSIATLLRWQTKVIISGIFCGFNGKTSTVVISELDKFTIKAEQLSSNCQRRSWQASLYSRHIM